MREMCKLRTWWLTLILCPEALVPMVALCHKMQPKPVFVADDGCRDIRPGKPVEETTQES